MRKRGVETIEVNQNTTPSARLTTHRGCSFNSHKDTSSNVRCVVPLRKE